MIFNALRNLYPHNRNTMSELTAADFNAPETSANVLYESNSSTAKLRAATLPKLILFLTHPTSISHSEFTSKFLKASMINCQDFLFTYRCYIDGHQLLAVLIAREATATLVELRVVRLKFFSSFHLIQLKGF